jgi:hypothetical protein
MRGSKKINEEPIYTSLEKLKNRLERVFLFPATITVFPHSDMITCIEILVSLTV